MKRLLKILSALFILTSCEEEIDLNIPVGEQKVVVYGIIENNLPPYLLLTESLDFFERVDSATVAETFIEDAKVTVFVDDKSFEMEPYELEINGFDFIAYGPTVDTLDTLGFKIPYLAEYKFGKIGKRYDLKIEVDGKTLTSTTTIPDTLSLYDFRFDANPDSDKDSLVSLTCSYDDPAILGNFGRLLTRVNQEQFLPDRFQSVYSDELINGGTWNSFVIPKGEDPNTDYSLETYSYFNRGDTVTVKWCAIDKAHYDFWITLETDRNNSGNPFGRPTVVKSNIEGGLGIWGGYGATYYTLIAPK